MYNRNTYSLSEFGVHSQKNVGQTELIQKASYFMKQNSRDIQKLSNIQIQKKAHELFRKIHPPHMIANH